MLNRRIIFDNIATPGAPVYRGRYATPLTPRAVRNEIIASAHDMPEHARHAWIQERLTPLDRMLDTEQSDALESYALCVRLLAGAARCGDYTGDRVQTSRSDMSPLPDKWMADLARHDAIKRKLGEQDAHIMKTFSRQMNDEDAWSDAEAAINHGLPGADRRTAWACRLALIAGVLIRL